LDGPAGHEPNPYGVDDGVDDVDMESLETDGIMTRPDFHGGWNGMERHHDRGHRFTAFAGLNTVRSCPQAWSVG